jgi:hypothetical protein
MNFLKRYSMSLIAFTLSLIVVFYLLDLAARKGGSSLLGTTGKRVGSLATGQAYAPDFAG